MLKARLRVEGLEAREVPANFWWTNETGNSLASEERNWSTDATDHRLPGEKDVVIFGYIDFKIGPADCIDLTSPDTPSGQSFAGMWVDASYNGTVFFGEALTAGWYTQAGGAIAQPDAAKSLTVSGTFTWTGGTLNNTPSDATVFVNGGGSITLPGVGGTLTAGSTLNFANPSGGGVKTTTIDGAGTLLLNGTSADNVFVRAETKVHLRADVNEQKIDGPGKKLTLDAGEWVYSGSGSRPLALQVTNSGGLFSIEGECHIKATGGGANTPSYWNTASGSRLYLQFGSKLEVANGCQIDGGNVYLISNADLPVEKQNATVKGAFSMTAGDIVFSLPAQIGTQTVYGSFIVDGTVEWTGGTFRPVLALGGSSVANRWFSTKLFSIVTKAGGVPNPNGPRIEPVLAPGQPVAGTWVVIMADGGISADGPPLLPQGWTLQPEVAPITGKVLNWAIKK